MVENVCGVKHLQLTTKERPMLSPDEYFIPLSVRRAFVIHFGPDVQIQAGHVTGRIEHIVSGRMVQFQSMEALLQFVAQILQEDRALPEP
jgi:hypothetical protein